MLHGIFTVLTFGSVYAIFGTHLMYLPLAMCMILAMYTPPSVCSQVFFGVLDVLDLGVFALLIQHCVVWFVASCKQQHELLIIVWESV